MDVSLMLHFLRDRETLETLLKIGRDFEWEGYSFDHTMDFYTIKDSEGDVLWCSRDYIGMDEVLAVLLKLKYGEGDEKK